MAMEMIKAGKLSEQYFYIRMKYNEAWIERIRTIEGRAWDKDRRLWMIPLKESAISQFLELFADLPLVIEPLLLEEQELFKKFSLQKSSALCDTKQGDLLDRFRDALKLHGYSLHTQKSYYTQMERFLKNTSIPITQLTKQDLRQYLLSLLESKHTHSSVNQTMSAMKIFFIEICGSSELVCSIPRPKKEKKLPDVLSIKEVMRLLQTIENRKHKAILYLTYSSGLRVGEVVRLKADDIDRERQLIHVRQSKGKKDRYTLLSNVALEVLEKYIESIPLRSWLFPSGDSGKHITERTVQKIFENALAKAKLNKKASVHSLRYPNLNKIQTFFKDA
jgi:integrase/recombinase XerD